LHGVSNDLRSSVQSGRTLKRDHYLLGMGDEWIGVFNRQARASQESEFGVALDWQEEAGEVRIERRWRVEGNGVHETLRIQPSFGDPLVDQESVIDGEARAFLETRLPEAITPFFLYDAERVQQIAEANREGLMKQIEQLLDLSDIDVLDDIWGVI